MDENKLLMCICTMRCLHSSASWTVGSLASVSFGQHPHHSMYPTNSNEKQMLALRVTYLVSCACYIGRRIANYSFRSKLSKADFFSPIRAE